MSQKNFRAPAVPLITHDPFFSVWSFADKLTDDETRHWDGVRKYMVGVLTVDGVIYEFMGSVNPDNSRYISGYRKLPQTGCDIRPMTTTYTFENEKLTMELKFTSPLLLNDLDILSRPISYVSYKITPKDGEKHDIHVHFGFSGEFCVNETTQSVHVGVTAYSIYFSSGTEEMLKRAGDDHRIEWGSFHVIAPDFQQDCMSLRSWQSKLSLEYGNKLWPINQMAAQGPNKELKGPGSYQAYEKTPVHPYYPTLVVRKNYTVEGGEIVDHIALGYDDVKSIQYFGENIEAYYRRNGDDFNMAMYKAITEYEEVLEKVHSFEEELLAKARTVSENYADILSLNYRLAIAGHKLTWHDGELQFFSKENYSNGCIATVDVTYPSVPLFLIYAPELVEGMLNPVFKLIEKGLWNYEFAPHDVGTYPLANGQVYGFTFRHRSYRPPIDSQMPVEECGNMILCVAAACFAKKDMAYFVKHRALLKQWADYLVKVGHNPDNQLCTDDFAGHLAHNCNLSVKGICGLAAYAKMLRACGETAEADKYEAIAKDYAAKWEEDAFDGDHYRLAFDQAGTWSLKYNMVWDKLLSLGLFSQQVYDLELAWYKKQLKPYGMPLDSRCDNTKTDWQMWSTKLFDDPEYTGMVVDAMWRYLCETPDRVPFSDLNFVSVPIMRGFQARTVQAGLFINLLQF